MAPQVAAADGTLESMRTALHLLLPGLLLACADPSDDDTDEVVTEPLPDPVLLEAVAPRWAEQLLIDATAGASGLPPVTLHHEGPDGNTTVLEEVLDANGARVGWAAPDGRWAPGDHRVSLDPALALWATEAEPIEHLDFTLPDTWAGDGREVEAWTVDALWLDNWTAGDVVLEALGEVVVVPAEPGGDWVLLTGLGDCAVYRGPVAGLPGGYRLALATLEVDIGGRQGPLVLEDTELAFVFASDGSEGVGQVHTLADGRLLTDLDEDGGIGPTFVCDLTASFGLPCHPCAPGDDAPLCLDLHAPYVHLVPREAPMEVDPHALPVCGVDVSGAELPDIEIELELAPIHCSGPTWPSWDPDLDLDLDCGCRSAPGRLGLTLAPVALLWWRRRRG